MSRTRSRRSRLLGVLGDDVDGGEHAAGPGEQLLDAELRLGEQALASSLEGDGPLVQGDRRLERLAARLERRDDPLELGEGLVVGERLDVGGAGRAVRWRRSRRVLLAAGLVAAGGRRGSGASRRHQPVDPSGRDHTDDHADGDDQRRRSRGTGTPSRGRWRSRASPARVGGPSLVAASGPRRARRRAACRPARRPGRGRSRRRRPGGRSRSRGRASPAVRARRATPGPPPATRARSRAGQLHDARRPQPERVEPPRLERPGGPAAPGASRAASRSWPRCAAASRSATTRAARSRSSPARSRDAASCARGPSRSSARRSASSSRRATPTRRSAGGPRRAGRARPPTPRPRPGPGRRAPRRR